MIGKGFYDTASGEVAPYELAIRKSWNCASDSFLSLLTGFVPTRYGKSN